MQPKDAFDQRDDIQLLDVREPYEWQAGHIEGATHIPMSQLNARQNEIAQDRTVVPVCRSGARSGQVTSALQRAGYQAENLDGGMMMWQASGLPVVTDSGAAGQVA